MCACDTARVRSLPRLRAACGERGVIKDSGKLVVLSRERLVVSTVRSWRVVVRGTERQRRFTW